MYNNVKPQGGLGKYQNKLLIRTVKRTVSKYKLFPIKIYLHLDHWHIKLDIMNAIIILPWTLKCFFNRNRPTNTYQLKANHIFRGVGTNSTVGCWVSHQILEEEKNNSY